MTSLLVELPKRVDEANVQEALEPFSFLISEAVIPCICLGMGQIQFGVCDIEVAASDDGLGGLKGLQEASEVLVPYLAVRKPCQLTLGVRDVDIHQMEARKFRDYHPSFRIVLAQP
jgi:hypothetical protein